MNSSAGACRWHYRRKETSVANPESREHDGGGQPAHPTVTRASSPEPSPTHQGAGQAVRDVVAAAPPPVPSRKIWARACSQTALIAGVFSLILGTLLLVNTFRLYRGPGNGKVRLVEARELLPLKAALREDPKNADLKNQVRQLDQDLRREYFRREHLASRGGWLLLGGAAVFLAALKLARHLQRPPIVIPNISLQREDPVRVAALAAKAVTGTALALAGLTLALVWDRGSQLQGVPTNTSAEGTSNPAGGAAGTAATIDPDWFPSAAEIASNWPYFRGPDGSGITTLTDLPESWDGPSGKNIRWKSEIGLPGENSPVVWGNRVFLTGATAELREVYCFDATSGALLWKAPVSTPQGERAEALEVMEDTGFAASTAATDGRRVFAIFANGDLAGFSAEGKRLWARSLGTPDNTYGHATSLTLWQNRVIVVFDQGDAKAGKSRIMALDANTGEPVWSTPRAVANSWVSPILIKYQGREQIITSADPLVAAYDPATGKELWRAKCMRGDVATSPAFANDLVYVACDQTCIAAIKPDGTGDVTASKIAWKQEDSGLPDMCSLLCDGPRVYTLVFGVFHALDALTGEHLWEHDPKAKFQASPSMSMGRIHLLTTTGVMISGVAGRDGFKETGRSALGEGTGASPAFAAGRIYLRGKQHLFCIGTEDGK
ncbi:MAG: PQQ-binding-like beta-propeller repeat protein [Verrucomicrobia bacterium]|nr:PQQ-binding-like beta-propeller repeat protein [Verrucomicrobiota bacterium]